ncbi:hypothetical protein [Actinoplanes derwentensis]|uniref:Uncharacterized protein n=1 Tax=Actinoplanes derwentensis TaxID=113562 RepID=A0A1H1V4K4_9ACTN|nr:hypothetical protein [Actinoplanes derwentensis]GID89223.1 hypothetical protein Ade03nite_81470 [Actinoplanes derwentensis]SDS79643.1 hypothetical protein SAMN04489716_1638 [Actinoplanes derwentensis]
MTFTAIEPSLFWSSATVIDVTRYKYELEVSNVNVVNHRRFEALTNGNNYPDDSRWMGPPAGGNPGTTSFETNGVYPFAAFAFIGDGLTHTFVVEAFANPQRGALIAIYSKANYPPGTRSPQSMGFGSTTLPIPPNSPTITVNFPTIDGRLYYFEVAPPSAEADTPGQPGSGTHQSFRITVNPSGFPDAPAPGTEDDDGTPKDTPIGEDPRDVDVPRPTTPAEPETCRSVLDMCNDYSIATGSAVRIDWRNRRILIVDPQEALPPGVVNGLGASYYSRITVDVEAGDETLRLDEGSQVQTASGDWLDNDLRVLDTQGCQRLPMPNLPPGKTVRLQYTFTPDRFTAQVDLVYDEVPLKSKIYSD